VLHEKYIHLKIEERVAISIYRKEGLGVNAIAKNINRNKSTVSRELKKNYWKPMSRVYNPAAAQRYYEERKTAKKSKIFDSAELQILVEEKLKNHWSPEVIAGRLKLENNKFQPSHETIYQFIYKKRADLIPFLKWNKKNRKRRGKLTRAIIKNRILIDERPKHIHLRQDFGHWEADTVESSRSGRSHLNVLIERKSRFVCITKIENKTPDETAKVICNRLKIFSSALRKTITYDNGIENLYHENINRNLNIKSYFCHPYSSWEKGSVENVNGLIRFYLPKKTNFDKITQKTIAEIEARLNNRPRKILGFKTPLEVFASVALVS